MRRGKRFRAREEVPGTVSPIAVGPEAAVPVPAAWVAAVPVAAGSRVATIKAIHGARGDAFNFFRRGATDPAAPTTSCAETNSQDEP
jgi:hypothetical protein